MAVAPPLPITTIRLPEWSSDSGQNWGCTTSPAKSARPGDLGSVRPVVVVVTGPEEHEAPPRYSVVEPSEASVRKVQVSVEESHSALATRVSNRM